jgi:hypothetical protein
MIEAHLVGMGEMRGAVVERMKDDPPSLKLRRDAGDEGEATARGTQDDPSAPSLSGWGKVSRGKLGRLPPECSFAAGGNATQSAKCRFEVTEEQVVSEELPHERSVRTMRNNHDTNDPQRLPSARRAV